MTCSLFVKMLCEMYVENPKQAWLRCLNMSVTMLASCVCKLNFAEVVL
jgi:hypothetical protein